MTLRKLQFLILATVLTATIPLYGVTIWNNGGPNPVNGNAMGDLQQAEDFDLLNEYNILSIKFWTLEEPGQYAGSFYYALHSNAGGNPGAVLGSGAVAAARVNQGVIDGLTLFENTLGVALNNVTAGSYWLALHNGPLANDAFSGVYWVWTNPNGTDPGLENWLNPVIPGWFSTDADHAFVLAGDLVDGGGVIPEPGTYALVGLGLASVLIARRRR